MYTRHSVLTIEEGLVLLSKWAQEFEALKVLNDQKLIAKFRMEKDTVGEITIKKYSQRYRLFLKGTTCVGCGLTASYFAIEKAMCSRAPKSYHINLYGTDEYGQEVMFTKDHIIPKSKGGKNHIDNYQLMCCHCNFAKADTLEGEEPKPYDRKPKGDIRVMYKSKTQKLTGLYTKLRERDFTVIEKISSKKRIVTLNLEDKYITCFYHKTRHGNITVEDVTEITKEDYEVFCTRFKSELEKKAEFMNAKVLA